MLRTTGYRRSGGSDIQVLASSSKGNCYLIFDEAAPLLLDCGIQLAKIQRGLNYSVAQIAGCLVTHEHLDHALAVEALTRLGVDCYMSEGTYRALLESGHLKAASCRSWSSMTSRPSSVPGHHRIKLVRARQQLKVAKWDILPFELEHDAQEPLGFLCSDGRRKILYLTDSYYCRYKFPGLTHILIECNYAKDILYQHVAAGSVAEAHKNRLLRSHFELSNVKEFLRQNDLAKVEAIYLIHLSNSNADGPRFKKEIQAATGKPVYIG